MIFAFAGNGYHAGKDTAAGYLAEYINDYIPDADVKFVSFADEVKLYVAKILGVNPDLSREDTIKFIDEFKEHGTLGTEVPESTHGYESIEMTGRDLIRNVAEGARSQFGTNFWIDRVDWGDLNTISIVTDLRFNAEMTAISQQGWYVGIRILRDEAIKDGHVSENGLEHFWFDVEIDNNGTKDELRIKIRKYAQQVFVEAQQNPSYATLLPDKIVFGE